MKKALISALLSFLFLLSGAPLALTEDTNPQLLMYRMKEGKTREVRQQFKVREKIFADFTFLPKKTETGVEFRWINPLNQKQQTYFELVKSPAPQKKRTVVCWLFLEPAMSARLFGYKLAGRWRLEIWVNNSLAVAKLFDVEN